MTFLTFQIFSKLVHLQRNKTLKRPLAPQTAIPRVLKEVLIIAQNRHGMTNERLRRCGWLPLFSQAVASSIQTVPCSVSGSASLLISANGCGSFITRQAGLEGKVEVEGVEVGLEVGLEGVEALEDMIQVKS